MADNTTGVSTPTNTIKQIELGGETYAIGTNWQDVDNKPFVWDKENSILTIKL